MILSQKENPWSGNTNSSVKKEIPSTVVSKEGHPDSLLEHKRIHHLKMIHLITVIPISIP